MPGASSPRRRGYHSATNTSSAPDNSLVVAVDQTIDCLVTDPTDQTIHAVVVTIVDFQTLSITVDVGDQVG